MSISRVGVVGAGSMGSGIAQVAAMAGAEVVLYDMNQEMVLQARETIRLSLAKLEDKGKLGPNESVSIFGRIYFAETKTAFETSELVIEAIVEDLSIKQSLFIELETICSKETVLATNTSSLSVSAIAAACRHPERVLGLHFFNPAVLMPLVEIIPAIQTEERLSESMLQLMRRWGKAPVLAKDTPGFIVNRIARPFYGEALRIYEEGLGTPSTIDHAMRSLGGFRMGPFELMDFIGHDINFAVTKSVFEAFFYDPRYKPSFAQQKLVEAGRLGRKSGIGFYDYSEGAVRPDPDSDVDLQKMIFERMLVMLINEAADALYLNIATRDDIDTAMTKGVNYPKGLLAWADEFGIQRCVDIMDQLFDYYRDGRYRCSPLLREMARGGKRFYD